MMQYRTLITGESFQDRCYAVSSLYNPYKNISKIEEGFEISYFKMFFKNNFIIYVYEYSNI